MVRDTVDLEALNCTICFEPLKPPVFQCAVGHVICSLCHDKLWNKGKCGVCSVTTGYNRCFTIEHVLESVRVPCHNSMYGCTTGTPYHEWEKHEKSCPHARCFCPEAGCGFTGSTAVLLGHFTTRHKWPSTEFEYGWRFSLQVQEGMQVLHSKHDGHLFMVKFTPAGPFGNATSVLCVEPRAGVERKFKCHLGFHCHAMGWHLSSDFQVRSTTLSDGLPTDHCYPFVVPNVSSDLSASITVRIEKMMMR